MKFFSILDRNEYEKNPVVQCLTKYCIPASKGGSISIVLFKLHNPVMIQWMIWM